MVITLKDGSVVTMFEAVEAKEFIGDEIYDFLEKSFKESDEKDELIHELRCENSDLIHDNDSMIDIFYGIESLVDNALCNLEENDLTKEKIKELLKEIKESVS